MTPLQAADPGGAAPTGLPGQANEAINDVGAAIGNGLSVAAQWAGDVLRSIFGCLPWDQSCEPAAEVASSVISHASVLAGAM